MPDVSGRDVFVLDFSFPRDVLLAARSSARTLLVLDHHKSAEADLAGLDFCKFDMQKSGSRLAWEHFYGSKALPWLVGYTEDRDLCCISCRIQKISMRHCAVTRSTLICGMELATFPNVFLPPIHFKSEGAAIRRRERQIVADHVRNATTLILAGHDILAVNATVLFSEIAGELSKGRPFGACYFDRKDGKRQWSLRSDEHGVDVSEIAKQYGGGGHFHAAGFEDYIVKSAGLTR